MSCATRHSTCLNKTVLRKNLQILFYFITNWTWSASTFDWLIKLSQQRQCLHRFHLLVGIHRLVRCLLDFQPQWDSVGSLRGLHLGEHRPTLDSMLDGRHRWDVGLVRRRDVGQERRLDVGLEHRRGEQLGKTLEGIVGRRNEQLEPKCDAC